MPSLHEVTDIPRSLCPRFGKHNALCKCKMMLLWLLLSLLSFPAWPCPQKLAAPVSSVTCGGTLGTHSFSSISLYQQSIGSLTSFTLPACGAGQSSLSGIRLSYCHTKTSSEHLTGPQGPALSWRGRKSGGLSVYSGRCLVSLCMRYKGEAEMSSHLKNLKNWVQGENVEQAEER